ncbi:MAG: hypothetical protein J6I97_09240 [Agathobacter sp.]|nr:hypothetical protein [Agathobacter sp.]
MKKETTKKRKRVSKAARQKQKLMITGGLAIILLILIIILAVFFLGSCGTNYAEADTNTVYVLKNGKIVSTDVEAFDEKTYDKDELGSYVKDVIDTYNKENGKNSLKQKSYEVEENVATLVLEYASADVYEDVNGVEIFMGSFKEAQKAGYKFEANFAKMSDGKAITATSDDFAKGEDYKVLIIKSNTKVVVPGQICFVSTENTAKVGKDYVIIKDGAQLMTDDSAIGTEYDTEFGTEAEGSDDSISEEELLNGEGEIIFDFGEEEEKGSQYSEVLTYIIYK